MSCSPQVMDKPLNRGFIAVAVVVAVAIAVD